MKRVWSTGSALMVLLGSIAGGAQGAPILDGKFTSADEVAFITASAMPLTDGWAFTTSSPLEADALGFFDVGSNGLATSHQVGLWSSTGSLLAQVTVDDASFPVASASSVGRWLFSDLASPILLPAGTYVLGASIPDVGTLTWFGGFVPADEFMINVNYTTVMLSPGVKFDGERWATNDQFTFPNLSSSQSLLYSSFGPNLLATSVPEPGAPSLLGLGIVGLWYWCRRTGRVPGRARLPPTRSLIRAVKSAPPGGPAALN